MVATDRRRACRPARSIARAWHAVVGWCARDGARFGWLESTIAATATWRLTWPHTDRRGSAGGARDHLRGIHRACGTDVALDDSQWRVFNVSGDVAGAHRLDTRS